MKSLYRTSRVQVKHRAGLGTGEYPYRVFPVRNRDQPRLRLHLSDTVRGHTDLMSKSSKGILEHRMVGVGRRYSRAAFTYAS